MAAPHKALASGWAARLIADLAANDQAATRLITGLTREQLNWQPAPGAWSAGQCIEHLRITNEAYLPAIGAALNSQPYCPVNEIRPGWFGAWFIRTLAEPLPTGKPAPAPKRIRPSDRVDHSVLDRFLSSNQSCQKVIIRAGDHDVNRVRFWNPFLPGLRLTVGTGMQIIVSHERRHLLQAERVKDAAGFPR
jgi:DinB superfamily